MRSQFPAEEVRTIAAQSLTSEIVDRGDSGVKSFFELLGQAMQSTDKTLRLSLLMLVAGAMAWAVSHLL